MEMSGPLRAVMIEVRAACTRAAAEKSDTVVDLVDPNVRGPYFAQIRAAGNAVLARSEREGIVGVEGCLCYTPAFSDLASAARLNQFEMGVRRTRRDGEVEDLYAFDVRVAAALDVREDGA